MEKDTTSEEKLLKLIRNKRPKENSDGKGPEKDNAEKPAIQISKKEKKGSDLLKTANILLVLVIIGILAYMTVNYLRSGSFESVEQDLVAEDDNILQAKREKAELKKSVRPFSEYRDVIEGNDVFLAPWEKPKTGSDDPRSFGAEISKNLKVVGIVLDEDPKAIVEDIKLRQTFFLSVGDSVGNAVLKEIHEGKVIFTIDNEQVELIP